MLAASDRLPATGPAPGTAWASPALARSPAASRSARSSQCTPSLPDQFRIDKIASASPLATFNDRVKRLERELVGGARHRRHPAGTRNQNASCRDSSRSSARRARTRASRHPRPAVATLDRGLTKLLAPFNAQRVDGPSRPAPARHRRWRGFGTVPHDHRRVRHPRPGSLLLVNVLLMLAEERLAELGTMRAVGLSRRPLIGVVHARRRAVRAIRISSSAAPLGVGLGRFMVWIAQGVTRAATRRAQGPASRPDFFASRRRAPRHRRGFPAFDHRRARARAIGSAASTSSAPSAGCPIPRGTCGATATAAAGARDLGGAVVGGVRRSTNSTPAAHRRTRVDNVHISRRARGAPVWIGHWHHRLRAFPT